MSSKPRPKGKSVVKHELTPAQKAAKTRAEKQALERAEAVRLAQIVNLSISGMSMAEIGAAIGASADEVEQMLLSDTARYVKTQPALRIYVRNWISSKYVKMIEADWDEAVDKKSANKLPNQDRVDRFLAQMARLHGAEAPKQTEVKIESAPEAVEQLVHALSMAQGLGYDTDVFDAEVVSDVVHESVSEAEMDLADAADAVGEDQPEDGDTL